MHELLRDIVPEAMHKPLRDIVPEAMHELLRLNPMDISLLPP